MPRPQSFALLSISVLLIASACGGTATDSGTSGSGGDAGSAGTAGSGGSGVAGGTAGTGGSAGNAGTGGSAGAGGSIPDSCAVETNEKAPYAVTFAFENYGLQNAYLHQGCRLRYEIKSCTDDYQNAMPIYADCTVDCSDDGGCIACGACLDEMIPIAQGMAHGDTWEGYHYTFGTTSQGCACHEQFVAPAGKYRIEVPVYDTADPYTAQPARMAIVDFTLPAPNDTVRVDVTLAYPED